MFSWKLELLPWKLTTSKFDGGRSTSMDVGGSFHGRSWRQLEASMEANKRCAYMEVDISRSTSMEADISFNGSRRTFPWR